MRAPARREVFHVARDQRSRVARRCHLEKGQIARVWEDDGERLDDDRLARQFDKGDESFDVDTLKPESGSKKNIPVLGNDAIVVQHRDSSRKDGVDKAAR